MHFFWFAEDFRNSSAEYWRHAAWSSCSRNRGRKEGQGGRPDPDLLAETREFTGEKSRGNMTKYDDMSPKATRSYVIFVGFSGLGGFPLMFFSRWCTRLSFFFLGGWGGWRGMGKPRGWKMDSNFQGIRHAQTWYDLVIWVWVCPYWYNYSSISLWMLHYQAILHLSSAELQ